MKIENNFEYIQNLKSIASGFENLSPNDIPCLIGSNSNHSISYSIVIGLPLLINNELILYNKITKFLYDKLDSNDFFYYSNNRNQNITHITTNIIGKNEGESMSENALIDLIELVKSYNNINFSFNLFKICPNGIILWKPTNECNDIFTFRSDLNYKIKNILEKHKLFGFDLDPYKKPFVYNIIHSAFLKKKYLNVEFDISFLDKIDKINKKIQNKNITISTCTLNKIFLIKEKIMIDSQKNIHYSIQKINS
jgi:hypothetical protein